MRMHSAKSKNKCENCGKLFSSGSIYNHVKICGESINAQFNCEKFSYTTTRKGDLKRHEENCQKKKDARLTEYTCF